MALPAALVAHLRRITDPADGPYLNAGVACIDAEGRATHYVCGRRSPDASWEEAPTWATARMRVASISKAVTGRAVVGLCRETQTHLDEPAFELLEWEIPEALGAPTIRQLLSHTSGLTDRAGYIVDPPDTLPAFLNAGAAESAGAEPPGQFFRYANLNYMILGALVEVISGQRFDQVVSRQVLKPAGIAGGFNWAGVPLPERAHVWPMYQRHGAQLRLEIDGPEGDWDADLMWRAGQGVSFAQMRLGRDTGLFSPHAGLRASLPELARLAKSFASDHPDARRQRDIVWSYGGPETGEGCDGLFPNFALGLSRFGPETRISAPLLGHAGHALGFSGGAWANLETKCAWAYALTGSADLTEGKDSETFFPPEELSILQSF